MAKYQSKLWFSLAAVVAVFAMAACSPVTLDDVKDDPESFVELDLSYSDITSLPSYVAKCSNLESISLVGNKLKTFPAELMSLPKLRRINLSFNEIDSLPADIVRLPAIEDLNLAGNKIRSIPAQLGIVPTLRKLDLSWNEITSIPPSFAAATQLQEIKAYDNLLFNSDSVRGSFCNAHLELDYCLDAYKAQYYLVRAAQYHNSQNADDAMFYYSKALSINDGLAAAYGNRGLLKLQTGEIDGAMEDFERCLHIDRQNPVVWLNRGLVRFNRGDKAGACEDWRNAANLGDQQALNLIAVNCR